MATVEDQSFAALERARSQRDLALTPYSSHLPEGTLNEYTRTVLTAYAQFVQRCVDSRVRFLLSDNHVCDASCGRIAHGDAFICKRSGNLHYCDMHRCDEWRAYCEFGTVSAFGENRCMFTGKSYGSDFQLKKDERSGCMSQFVDEKVKATKPPKVKGPRPKRVRSKTGVKGRKLAKQTIEKQNNQHALFSQACTHLSAMLRHSGVELTECVRTRFAATCVALWGKVHQKAEKLYRAIKYRFKYHCIVIMYYMQSGLAIEGKPLLTHNDFFATHLPDMKDLDKYKIRTKWHTRSTRQFLYAIRCLPADEMTALATRVCAIWV